VLFIAGVLAAHMTLEVLAHDGELTPFQLLLELMETLLMAAAIAGLVLLVQRLRSQRAERLELVRDLRLARAQGEAWRDEARAYVEGLGAAIERQFAQWGLTGAEREVGMLMLKGFTHEEVASLRGTTAATARQQAYAIYKKSKLPNRTAFAAYFMEDLLPTSAPGGVAAPVEVREGEAWTRAGVLAAGDVVPEPALGAASRPPA